MFQFLRTVAADSLLALFRVRYLVQAQPYSLLSGPEKRAVIRQWQEMTGHRLFVETGTFLGDTALAMADVFDRCWTVEIDPALYEQAAAKLRDRPNVTALRGDSGTQKRDIVAALDAPAIFRLDGH